MNKMKPTRYIRSLDGLRGLAVLAVIAYHLNFSWASGGFLGVTIFFVLSGYLITNLLVIEYEQNNKIDLKNFWIRRVRRLLPAMFTMLIAVTAWATLFARPFLERLRDDFIPALLYYSNWWYIYQELSYFEAMSTPSLLTHFWSLAIEEQFYIIWPLLIAGAFLCHMNKKQMVKLTLLMALLSSLLMALIYSPTTDPSRVYYGTDTRAFSLLIGAALAFIWPSQKLAKTIPVSLRRSMDVVGAVCLAAILIMMVIVNQYDGFLYRGGMLLASLLTASLLAVLIHPASKLGTLMTFKPLTWVGERSYGIYLWHFPVILLTSPQITTSETSSLIFAVQIALTLVLAALSYKYIENPIRKGAISSFYTKVRSRDWTLKQTTYRQWFTIGCMILLITVSCIGLGAKSISVSQTENSNTGSTKTSEQSSNIPDTKEDASTETTPSEKAEKDEQLADKEAANKDAKQSEKAPADYNITIIGDSVMVNVEPFIKAHFPNTTVDASIGRQLYEGTSLIKNMNQNNTLGDIVIIALGTNGSFTSDQLDDALEAVGTDHLVFLINTRVPRNWESIVNDRLAEAADNNPSVHLIDWYSTSSGHNEYFENDGIHLTQTGAKAYAAMIAAEVQK